MIELKKKIINCFVSELKLIKKDKRKILNNNITSFRLGVHKNWDSLKHVVILNKIEKITKKKITPKNFKYFQDLRSIFSYLKL